MHQFFKGATILLFKNMIYTMHYI